MQAIEGFDTSKLKHTETCEKSGWKECKLSFQHLSVDLSFSPVSVV